MFSQGPGLGWGVAGAAAATGVSQVVALLVLLRGLLPRTWDVPLVLELHGVAILYAQRVEGVWLINFSHPLSAYQAFCTALSLQAIDRVAEVCRKQAAAAAAAAQQALSDAPGVPQLARSAADGDEWRETPVVKPLWRQHLREHMAMARA